MGTVRRIVLENELEQRLAWLIWLRWFAVAGTAAVLGFARYFLEMNLPFHALMLCALGLLLSNILYFAWNRILDARRDSGGWYRRAQILANTQISGDLLLLACLLHFSGGLENPFIFYFIFHMVIASILLTNRAAYLQAAFALFLITGLLLLPGLGVLTHHHLDKVLPICACTGESLYPYGVIISLGSTLFLVVFMTTTIVNRVRDGERALIIANQKLAEQDKLKSRYVLTVSHDIQSSLSTIQMLLHTVSKGLAGDVSDRAREMVTRAENRSTSLIGFVKELLDLSRMRAADQLEKEPVGLHEAVQQVFRNLKPLAERKKIDLNHSVSPESRILANSRALNELLQNLVANGIRYTPEGGRVTLEQLANGEGQVRFRVSDTGIGIPGDALPHIFDDFFRARNAKAHAKDGTGLGMAIVKQIVTGHGGTITVESQEGKGTAFTVALPSAPPRKTPGDAFGDTRG